MINESVNQAAALKLAESGDVLVLTQHSDDRGGGETVEKQNQRRRVGAFASAIYTLYSPFPQHSRTTFEGFCVI